MFKPVEVKPLPNYKLWIKYDDGVQGEVDLSYLVGKGVFSVWKDPMVFQKVRIGEHDEIVWDDNLDLCPNALYLQITGKTAEEAFPKLKKSA